jgi:hypothetical protein
MTTVIRVEVEIKEMMRKEEKINHNQKVAVETERNTQVILNYMN